LDIEDQGCVGRDHSSDTLRAVAQIGRDFQLPFAAYLHACDAIVPALNHVSPTQLELKGPFADGAVELLATGQPASVIYGHFFSGTRGCSRARHDVPVLDTGRRCLWLAGDLSWASGLRENSHCSKNCDEEGQKKRLFHVGMIPP